MRFFMLTYKFRPMIFDTITNILLFSYILQNNRPRKPKKLYYANLCEF